MLEEKSEIEKQHLTLTKEEEQIRKKITEIKEREDEAVEFKERLDRQQEALVSRERSLEEREQALEVFSVLNDDLKVILLRSKKHFSTKQRLEQKTSSTLR